MSACTGVPLHNLLWQLADLYLPPQRLSLPFNSSTPPNPCPDPCPILAPHLRRLCNATQPGQGRVLACLQENRADIEGEGCKRQMLRLLGLMVEDVRLDFNLLQVRMWCPVWCLLASGLQTFPLRAHHPMALPGMVHATYLLDERRHLAGGGMMAGP